MSFCGMLTDDIGVRYLDLSFLLGWFPSVVINLAETLHLLRTLEPKSRTATKKRNSFHFDFMIHIKLKTPTFVV